MNFQETICSKIHRYDLLCTFTDMACYEPLNSCLPSDEWSPKFAGEGTFGQVSIFTKLKRNGRERKVAVKRWTGNRANDNARIEINFLRLLKCPYVVKLLKVVSCQGIAAAILKAYDCDLRRYSASFGKITFLRATRIMIQIVKGIAHLHALGYMHSDLKPANILVKLGPQLQVVVADLGLAKNAFPTDGTHFPYSPSGIEPPKYVFVDPTMIRK